MLVATLSLLGGLVILVLAADRLVDGAVAAARRLGISTLVVGLTVVAYGTSFPEFVVSVIAAWRGVGEFAVGNVVGSNIANIALVLGLTASIAAVRIAEPALLRRDLPTLVAATLFAIFALSSGELPQWEGLVLFSIAIGYTALCLRRGETPAGVDAGDEPEAGDDEPPMSWRRIAVLLAVGFAGLIIGAHLLVEGGSGVARLLGVPERVIALTIVALGTSLPELAASIAGAAKGHPELAVGNVIGSNIFNLTFVLGAAAMVREVPVDFHAMRADVAVLGVATLLMEVTLRWRGGVGRPLGGLLVAGYLAYVGHLAHGVITAGV